MLNGKLNQANFIGSINKYTYARMYVSVCAETKADACLRIRRMLSVFDRCEWHAIWRRQEKQVELSRMNYICMYICMYNGS